MVEFYPFLKYFSIATALFPFVAAIFLYKSLKNEIKVLFIYITASLLADGICIYLARQGYPNYLVRNLFTLIEFGCLAYIFYKKFDSYVIKNLTKVVSMFFFFTATLLLVVFNKLNKQEDILSAISAFFFMLLGYTYMYHLFRDYDFDKFRDNAFFWVNNAILIYFSANFVLFLFFGYVVNFEMERFYLIYSLNRITYIAYNLILTVGIWKVKNN